jgi:hypothetical protein
MLSVWTRDAHDEAVKDRIRCVWQTLLLFVLMVRRWGAVR